MARVESSAWITTPCPDPDLSVENTPGVNLLKLIANGDVVPWAASTVIV
jgi:hypothetical protein